MSRRIRVPDCCDLNRKFGFIRAVECHDDDMNPDPDGEWGARWQATLVDASGIPHTIEAERCPACGHYVKGTGLVDLPPIDQVRVRV